MEILTRTLSTILLVLSPFFPQAYPFAPLAENVSKPAEWGKNPPLLSSILSLNPNLFPIRDWRISEPETKIKSGLVYLISGRRDEATGLIDDDEIRTRSILYRQSIDESLPIASLSKMMTAIVVVEGLDLKATTTVSQTAVETYGGSGGLAVNEKISVENLLYALLMESSNDAATALAEYYEKVRHQSLVDSMNKKAVELGLKKTFFEDPSGLSPRNFSTADEIARIVEYGFKHPIVWQIQKTITKDVFSADGQIKHHWENTDVLLNQLDNIVGGKTGYTNEAGGCLILLLERKPAEGEADAEYLLSVVLGAQERFLETEKLINWVEEAYKWR